MVIIPYISRLICSRCNHVWIPRRIEIKICPKCKRNSIAIKENG